MSQIVIVINPIIIVVDLIKNPIILDIRFSARLEIVSCRVGLTEIIISFFHGIIKLLNKKAILKKFQTYLIVPMYILFKVFGIYIKYQNRTSLISTLSTGSLLEKDIFD